MSAAWMIGCTISTDYAGTAYTCQDGRCPAGFRCVEGKCLDGIDDDAGSPSDATVDAVVADAAPDADLCPFEPRSDSCQPGELEELTDVREAGGQIVCGSTVGTNNDLFGCTGAPLPGLDSVFRVATSAGERITATLRPMGFNGAVYLLTDCSGQCLDLADDQGVGGTETAQFTTTITGDHYVVVDSGTGAGAYELTVAVQ